MRPEMRALPITSATVLRTDLYDLTLAGLHGRTLKGEGRAPQFDDRTNQSGSGSENLWLNRCNSIIIRLLENSSWTGSSGVSSPYGRLPSDPTSHFSQAPALPSTLLFAGLRLSRRDITDRAEAKPPSIEASRAGPD